MESNESRAGRDKDAEDRAERLLEIAVRNHEDVIFALNDASESVRAVAATGETDAVVEVKRLDAMINKTIANVYDERRRLDEYAKRHGLGHARDELDFDEIRAGLRRKLDDLRAAADAGPFPSEPE